MNGKYRGVVKGIDMPKNRWAFGDRVKIGNKVYIVLDDAEIESAKSFKRSLEISGIVEVIPSTVGQSTGREDKKKKDSYAGDIICYENDYPYGLATGPTSADTNNDIGEIYWNDGMSCFSVQSGEYAREQIDIPLWRLLDEYGEFEIIGNIHDDLKLLEAKE